MNKIITSIYSGDSQGGGDLPYFVGKQYGSGWLRSVARFAFPLFKKVLKSAGSVALNTAGDLLKGDDNKAFGETLRKNALKELKSATTNSINRGYKRKRQQSSQGTIFSKKRKRK